MGSVGTAKGMWESYSKFFPHFCFPLRLVTSLRASYSVYLTFTSPVAQLWKRQGDGRGCVARHRHVPLSLGLPRGLTVTPCNRDFDLFSLLQVWLAVVYLWQLRYGSSVKTNNAHISRLQWNWNLFKLIEHAGIWYIEHLAVKSSSIRVYNGILDLNDHLSARKRR